ncbi:hypothetical protein CCB80_00835 [Armatimonadetes bacterium Uphvl-Ar1]|nr:hypothetical protein CCB80_00835 [Armatimonadetes bacterium Uphvl-Ar1]
MTVDFSLTGNQNEQNNIRQKLTKHLKELGFEKRYCRIKKRRVWILENPSNESVAAVYNLFERISRFDEGLFKIRFFPKNWRFTRVYMEYR